MVTFSSIEPTIPGSHRLGLGTYHLTSDRGVAHHDAVALLRGARRRGISTFDTAPMYGLGEAEFLLRIALGDELAELDLIDKIGRFELSILRRLGMSPYLRTDQMLLQLEHSLRLLGTSRIGTLLVHETDWTEWWPAEIGAVDAPVSQFLREAKERDLVDLVGISARQPDRATRLIRSGRFDRILFVHYCNVVWQEGLSVAAEASEHGVQFLVGAPYRQGILVHASDDDLAALVAAKRTSVPPGAIQRIRAVREVAEESGMSILELGLRWLLSDERIATVLVGPRSLAELDENLEWAEQGPLEPALMSRLSAVSAIPLGSWEQTS